MDNYNNRGNGNKYSSSKNQTKTYTRSHGRSVSIRSHFGTICIIPLTFLLVYLQHDEEMHADRDRNDDYYAKKPKKPDQYFHPSQQQQQQQKSDKGRYERTFDNRRQGSEPRAGGGNNNYSNQDSMKSTYVNSDRNRDTRSSEPGASGNHYEQRNKPPPGPGPRINNSAFLRLPLNIDSLPPRLKKKCLLDAGLPESLADKPIMQEMSQQSYSNTLPGRGRNNRYDQQNSHHQNYHNSYQPKYNNNQGYQQHDQHDSYRHRSLTPPLAKASRPQLKQHQEHKPAPPRSDWKPNDVQKRESSPPMSKISYTDSNFDWNEDVMNSQSLPPEINAKSNVQPKTYDDNNRHRHRRRRNRRLVMSKL